MTDDECRAAFGLPVAELARAAEIVLFLREHGVSAASGDEAEADLSDVLIEMDTDGAAATLAGWLRGEIKG